MNARALFISISLLALPMAAEPQGGRVSFNNQIQPILSENCYLCHGPDSATRKPKKQPLRLDREQFAFEPREDGKPVIIKGNPAASEVMRRLKATDDDVMPPASQHKKIKPEEIALIERWIAEGAVYEKHWSLIPPTRPEVPAAGSKWARNPIDHFVAAKLAENGLKPNPEEQKARLFRRLSFDLRGLPPSTTELHEFLADKSAGAYEKAVDRMLASDACAEQFARHWLDAVRYADTQGIHHDHYRTIWPYRDWVIAAFKANMPFNEFTIEQLGGDLLPNATLEQKIASGYNRLLPTTGEGGAIPEEYAAIYAKDRADTTSAVWLGLTTGCATCHDHKFDPITMKDFYSMTAFFRNGTQSILDSGSSGDNAPMVVVPAKADRQHWAELERAIGTVRKSIADRKEKAKGEFEEWVKAKSESPYVVSYSDSESQTAPSLLLPLYETNAPYRGVAGKDVIEWSETTTQRPGPFGPAPRLADGAIVTNANPTFGRYDQASYGAFLYVENKPNGAVFSRMDNAQGYRGWDFFLSSGKPTVHIVDQYPEHSLKVTAKEVLKPGQWHHVMAVFDGTRKGAEAIAVFVNGRKAEVEVNNNNLGTNIVSDVPLRLSGRSNNGKAADTISGGKVFIQDLRFYNRALAPLEVVEVAASGLVRDYNLAKATGKAESQKQKLSDLFFSEFDQPSQKLQMELAKLTTEEKEIRGRGTTTLVMEEKRDRQPMANILVRGNYLSKGAEVTANTPDALPHMTPDQPHNRLGLARWFLDRDNPLTARVMVNRLWHHLFGIGIVETTEDFGVKGARPTNQPLLDWLACEFQSPESKVQSRKDGTQDFPAPWDLRHIVKLMVMSSSYRQSEAASPDKLERDPQNKLCSRGPHLRLEAEEIRDQALAASGLLVDKIGGPPVKPYQPEGVWESVAMKDSNTRNYVQDHGDALYRRSLYTFWKRVAPPPSLEILNAPSREVFCTRRDRTDTPLQAFVTMNDPQFVEAARNLAAKTLRTTKGFDGCVNQISEALLARDLSAKEKPVVKKIYDRAMENYKKDGKAADELITVGESKPDKSLPPVELAAWTLVASEIMNLDESLTK
jgi:hypothetical protein